MARLARRIRQGCGVSALLGVLGIGALLASLWLDHRTPVTLPRPTGTYAVGRTIEAWTDDGQTDELAPVPGTPRELAVWIWYPAAAPSGARAADYLPASWRAAVERARGALIGKLLTRDLSRVHAHSLPNAAVAPRQRPYPVAILRAGASAEAWNYSTLAEDLASHGYVVVGFDAPYRTNVVVFPDGRVIHRRPENNPELCLRVRGQARDRCVNRLLAAWSADIAFVLDRLERLSTDAAGRFAGRLDLSRVGVFGHSFGGAAALRFCHDDARCKAGIDIDGAPFGSVIQSGLHQPFMFLVSDHSKEPDAETRQIGADIRSIYDRLPADGRAFIQIRGANHFLFSDDGALLKSRILLRALRALGIVGIDGRRQLAVAAYCVHSFFDAYLKGASPSKLELASPLYPEIRAVE
jgi:predicted dienelactone hydrolase